MKKIAMKQIFLFPVFFLVIVLINSFPTARVGAETASAVTIGVINYEELTLQLYNNNNTKVFYSVDNTTWIEVDAAYNTTSKSYSMDISWILNNKETTLYYRGDVITTVQIVTIPSQDTSFGVTFDKVEGEFTFKNSETSDYFEWRKTSDYTWNKVSFEETSISYQGFLSIIETLRVKGAKLIFRLPQLIGSSSNAGSRPSKEVSVTIAARSEGPLINVNSSKLTLNTTALMEYYDVNTSYWVDCSRSMSIDMIAPSVLKQNGSRNVTLMIRTAATDKSTYSKTTNISIPGQASEPTIGDSSKEVSYYFANSKLVLCFNKASVTNVFEYTIMKAGGAFTVETAKWTSVMSTKPITFTNKTAPLGCIVYVRKKGTDASSSKSISLVLASAYNSITTNY